MTPTTACRLCVVEVEGARTLVASCAYPVADKMVVHTDTERVRKARKLVIELLALGSSIRLHDLREERHLQAGEIRL